MRISRGSRLSRDWLALAGGSGNDRGHVGAPRGDMLECGIDHGAAHRGEIDRDRAARRIAVDDGRVEVELLGLERGVAVEVVASACTRFSSSAAGSVEALAQAVLREAGSRRRAARAPAVARRRRSPRCPRRRACRERDLTRNVHDRMAVLHRRPPQRRAVAREREHGAHAPARDRRTRRRRHQRRRARRATIAGSRRAAPASDVAQACAIRRQREFPVGHGLRYLRGSLLVEFAIAVGTATVLPSRQFNVSRGRRASPDGRTTASRTNVTPSGAVAAARMCHTGTAPATKFAAGGNGGTGSLAARASSRCARYASTSSGVAVGSASSTSRGRERGLIARLPRVAR